jgi:ADP-ribose pyrophosphatase YjhB (NUDIX family)
MRSDVSEKELTDYPQPSVAVDTAVLSVGPAQSSLEVVLHRRAGNHRGNEWALPGTFLWEGETLAVAVRRSLRNKAGLDVAIDPDQLHVFDDPDRDERGRVLSVAHVAVVPWEQIARALDDRPADLCTRPVDEVRGLPFDHDAIVRLAADRVRQEYALRPDPRGLLPERFTLRQLYALHMAVAPRPGPGEKQPSSDTFRRYMVETQKLVEPTGEMARGAGAGKPAQWYRRAVADRDLTAVVGVRPIRPA